MPADFGAKINTRKRAVRIDPDVIKDVGTKWGSKGDGISFKIGDTGEETEEVTFDKFLLENPKLFSAVIDDCVLVRVVVDGEGTGRGMEEIGEEVFYRYFWE